MTQFTKAIRMALVVVLMIALVIPSTVVASTSTTVVKLWVGNNTMAIGGVRQPIDSEGTKPVIVEGRTFVPIRAVIEAFGGSVAWEATTRKVTVSLGQNALQLWIGSSEASLNGIMISIDTANPRVLPVITSGRTMLPLRFVSESLGIDVQYEATTKMITLTYTVDMTPPPLPAPMLVSPADGSRYLNESPRLSWLPATGADASRVQILSSGVEVHAKTGLPGVEYAIPAGLLSDGTYSWRASVHNAGGWGTWSSSRTFTIVTVAPPATPAVLGPDDGSAVNAEAVSLKWTPVPDAMFYRVRVLLGTDVVHEAEGFAEVSYIVPEGTLRSNTYSWQVAAQGIGGWSPWSEVRTIRVRAKLNVGEIAKFVDRIVKVTVQGSKNGSLFESSGSGFFASRDGRVITSYSILDYALSGTVTLSGGQQYNLVSVLGYDKTRDTAVIKVGGTDFPVCELGNPSALVIGEPVVSVSSPLLVQNAVSEGTISAVSADAIHTTALAPSGSSGGPLFNMYGEVVGVVSSVAQAGGSLAVAIPISALSHVEVTDTGYSLKQVYQKEHGTVPEPPQPPVLSLPVDGATVNPYEVALTWKTSAGADKYTVWIGTGAVPLDSVEVLHEDTTAISYKVPTTLLVPDGSYCWQVAAHNKNGWSDWSNTRTFQTLPQSAIPVLTAPLLFLPEEKWPLILQSGETATFSWNTVSGAEHYVIWFGLGTTGTDSSEVFRDTAFGTSYELPSGKLQAGRVYTWAVYAVSPGGRMGPWSANGHFSVVLLESPRLYYPTPDRPLILYSGYAGPRWMWSRADYANVYVLEVGTGTTAFQGTTVFTVTLVNKTEYALSSGSLLQFAGTRLFWWSVTAMDGADYTVGIAWGFFYTVGP